MRSLSHCLFILSLFSCQPKAATHEDPALDSLWLDLDSTQFARADTSVFAGSQYDELATAIDSLIIHRDAKTEYTLTLEASGHEYTTEGVFRFDSLFNFVRYDQNWASEGREGESHVFLQANKIYALLEETGNGSESRVDLYHQDLGGISYMKNGGGDSLAHVSPLNLRIPRQTRDELRRQLQDVLRLLKQNEKAIKGDKEATLDVKSDDQSGDVQAMDRTTITLDRKLLKKLLE